MVIEEEAFSGCSSLRSIGLPNGVKRIEKRCFWESGVEEVTLPSTLKWIEKDAMMRCGKLRIVWL